EHFEGAILDPACGSGNIVNACQSRGLRAYGSDIVPRGMRIGCSRDFLVTPDSLVAEDNIICNPPFKISLDFAFIQRLCWLEGQKRAAFMESSPLARIYVFRNRICMPPGEKKDLPAKGGFIAYAWFVWEHGHKGPATVHWISTNQ